MVSYVSSHFGAVSPRRRALLLCWKEWVVPPPDVNPPPFHADIPLEPEAKVATLALEGTLIQEPGIVTTGDPWLPHPFGHVRGPGFPPKCLA